MTEVSDPKSVVVDKSGGTGMDIEWRDGHRSHYTFQWLRDACPCAMCKEERKESGRILGVPPATAPGALPMFRPTPHPTEVHPAGKYAINFVWNDGHQHGIYSWAYLREYCPCTLCRSTQGEK